MQWFNEMCWVFYSQACLNNESMFYDQGGHKTTLKKICLTLKLMVRTINDEWFSGIQWSDQELRSFELLQRMDTVNSCTLHNVANRLSTVCHQHVCFCEVVWLVVPVAFQADSDFYVVAELLKDYIGLIQAVKVRNDVFILQCVFQNQLLFFYDLFSDLNTLNVGDQLIKKPPLVVLYEASLVMSLETFRAKHRQFVYRVLCCRSR